MHVHSPPSLRRPCHLALAILLAGGAGTAYADIQINASGGVRNTSGFGRHNLDAMPTGALYIFATAEDTIGGPDSRQATGNYATGSSLEAGLAVSTGPLFEPDSMARIRWNWDPGNAGSGGQWYWTSEGSFAHMHPGDGSPLPPNVVEEARSVAYSADPNTYVGQWAPFETDTLTYTLTFEAGLTLDVSGSTTGSARISGDAHSSLIGGNLWTYDWSAGPTGGGFSFWSNPVLGLDDGAISSAFLSMLSTSAGVSTLPSDFSVSATLNVAADADGHISITTGGGTRYETEDQGSVPAPGSLALLALGGLVAGRRRRR